MQIKKYVILLLCLVLTLSPISLFAEGESTEQQNNEVTQEEQENTEEPVIEEVTKPEPDSGQEEPKEKETEEKQKETTEPIKEESPTEKQDTSTEQPKEEPKKEENTEEVPVKEPEVEDVENPEQLGASKTENNGAQNGSTSAYVQVNEKLYNPEVGTKLRYPLATKGTLTSGYGTRVPFMTPGGMSTSFHGGIDIAAPMGTHVLAAEAGKITIASWFGGYGNCIEVTHADGMKTRYGHLSEINVKVGDNVLRGQLIGKVGSTGISTGPHLHFEVYPDGKTAVNPAPFLTDTAENTEKEYSNIKFLFVDRDSIKDEQEEETTLIGKSLIDYIVTQAEEPVDEITDTLSLINKTYNTIDIDLVSQDIKDLYTKLTSEEINAKIVSSKLDSYKTKDIKTWQAGDILIFGNEDTDFYDIGIYSGNDTIIQYEDNIIEQQLYSNEDITFNELPITYVVRLIEDEIEQQVKYDVFFQLTERMPIEIVDGKTVIDISYFYKNGLIKDDPAKIIPTEDIKVEFVKEDIFENTKSTHKIDIENEEQFLDKENSQSEKIVIDTVYKLVIDKEIKQSEIQLIIPSNKMENVNVITYINSDFETIDSDIYEFNPLFNMTLDLDIEEITKNNFEIKIDDKTLTSNYYEYNDGTLTIKYSPLYISELDITIKELEEIEQPEGEEQQVNETEKVDELPEIKDVNNISNWVTINSMDLSGFSTFIENCYVIKSLTTHDISSEYYLPKYNRYNLEINEEEAQGNLVIDNSLGDSYISMPLDIVEEMTTPVNSSLYSNDEQLIIFNNNNYGPFIYGENIYSKYEIEEGYKTVNFNILDYKNIDGVDYFIVFYSMEDVGGYFGIQINNQNQN